MYDTIKYHISNNYIVFLKRLKLIQALFLISKKRDNIIFKDLLNTAVNYTMKTINVARSLLIDEAVKFRNSPKWQKKRK